jgi:hypothetical protein
MEWNGSAREGEREVEERVLEIASLLVSSMRVPSVPPIYPLGKVQVLSLQSGEGEEEGWGGGGGGGAGWGGVVNGWRKEGGVMGPLHYHSWCGRPKCKWAALLTPPSIHPFSLLSPPYLTETPKVEKQPSPNSRPQMHAMVRASTIIEF